MVVVFHYYCEIMSSNLVLKKEGLGEFIILYTIMMYQFAKELYKLRESINLMPFETFKELGLGYPKTTTTLLLIVDWSIK